MTIYACATTRVDGGKGGEVTVLLTHHDAGSRLEAAEAAAEDNANPFEPGWVILQVRVFEEEGTVFKIRRRPLYQAIEAKKP